MAIRRIFKEFCDNSTIHGIRYFSERKRHWSERSFWAIAFIFSLLVCSSSIRNVWLKWLDKPVTLSLSEKEEPISSIPFPTITICPYNKIKQNKLQTNLRTAFKTWVKAPDNVSDVEISRMRTLFHICQQNDIFLPPDEGEKFTSSSIYETIVDMAPQRNTLQCQWMKEGYPCHEFFDLIYTDGGLCFAFNTLNSHEFYTKHMAPELMTVTRSANISNWDPNDGYGEESQQGEYPIRIFNAKQGLAFHVSLLVQTNDIEYLCSGLLEGFKVTLTTPGETRRSYTRYFNALLSEQLDIFIKPRLVMTSNKLRSYKPIQRQCFFNSERQLRFFKIYTQANCELECLSNFTKNECGCVKFSMPRDRETKICGSGNIQCYRDSETRLYGQDVIKNVKNDSIKVFRGECNCLPACTSINYDADVDRTKFEYKRILKALDVLDSDFSNMQMAILSVFFIEPQVTTLVRAELYTYIDFLAICGGLLGLFLGVSVLSIIEFVYYATLRLFWNIRKSRAENAVKPFERKGISRSTINSLNSRKAEYLE